MSPSSTSESNSSNSKEYNTFGIILLVFASVALVLSSVWVIHLTRQLRLAQKQREPTPVERRPSLERQASSISLPSSVRRFLGAGVGIGVMVEPGDQSYSGDESNSSRPTVQREPSLLYMGPPLDEDGHELIDVMLV